ncbi:carboxypeptidase M32 [Tolumonas lignilytica]|uniref:carboxypeptidase M32 n=1 Tax=Tolumonas lignilytica TaxID=1283284 RepID=UPI00046557E6|nr:carboxypeptidase M32 [Tolumonas lignilytica]
MSYQLLTQRFQQLHHLQHLQAICGWDQATMMPDGGNQARGEALAELALLQHQKLTAIEVADWLNEAENEELSDAQTANLHEMRRRWQNAALLPDDLVQARTLAGSRCEHAWREQRKNNDWKGFEPNLKIVVDLTREAAQIRAESLDLSPYDSLIDLYEPGMTSNQLLRIFNELKTWLPQIIRQAGERQSLSNPIKPEGPFSIARQKSLGLHAMKLLGFDFNHGRLDISAHPFCGGVPEDVRITTRYNEHDFMPSLMGVIHETGHARYEQGLPLAWRGQPAGEARSMGIHESQSLFFEMQLARHPAFLRRIEPLIKQHFGDQPALEAENLIQLYSRVAPGFIRVDADELTYPAHIILRFEIEQSLIDGKIQVHDLPDVWNSKMQQYLGLTTKGNDAIGCMQDIHWTDGSFGYFPSYTLGALYAAQFAGIIERDVGNIGDLIMADDGLPQIFNWLKTNVWEKASLYSTDELLRQATGEPLNTQWFKHYLEQRYTATL